MYACLETSNFTRLLQTSEQVSSLAPISSRTLWPLTCSWWIRSQNDGCVATSWFWFSSLGHYKRWGFFLLSSLYPYYIVLVPQSPDINLILILLTLHWVFTWLQKCFSQLSHVVKCDCFSFSVLLFIFLYMFLKIFLKLIVVLCLLSALTSRLILLLNLSDT